MADNETDVAAGYKTAAEAARIHFEAIRDAIIMELQRENPAPSQDTVEALHRVKKAVVKWYDFWTEQAAKK
jgi:hypothetical protein